MTEVEGDLQNETQKSEFAVRNENGLFEVSSPFVDLSSEEEPLKFAVTLEKVPTLVEDGIELYGITIDRDSPKLKEMLKQAEALKGLPEKEKPRRILELLRSNIHFAYNDVLEKVAKTDPELAKWVAENTGINSSSAKPVTLSEIVDKGYGVCRHLSVAMLVLAKEAGMEGALLTQSSGILHKTDLKYLARNIIRQDNNEPLFKLIEVGKTIENVGHAWVELRTSGGEWISVDPSTQLVGDTQEGLDTFKEANYRASVGSSMEMDQFPKNVNHNGNQDLWFLPGEQRHTGILEVNSQQKKRPIILSLNKKQENAKDNTEVWPKPTKYKGSLNFNLSSHAASDGLTVGIVDVKPLQT